MRRIVHNCKIWLGLYSLSFCLVSVCLAQNAVYDEIKNLQSTPILKNSYVDIQADQNGVKIHNYKHYELNQRNHLIVRKDRFLNKHYNDEQRAGITESAIAFEFINKNFTGMDLSSHFISYKKHQNLERFSFYDSLNQSERISSFTIAQELTQNLGDRFSFNLLAGIVHCNDELRRTRFYAPKAMLGLNYSDELFQSSISYKHGPDSIAVFSPFSGININKVLAFNANIKLNEKFNLQLDCQHVNTENMLQSNQDIPNSIVLAKASLSYKIKSKLSANVHYRFIDQGLNHTDTYQGTKTSFSLSYAAF